MLETLGQLSEKPTKGRVLTESTDLNEDAGHSVLDIISKAQLDKLCKMHNDGKDFTDDKALCDKFCKYYDLEPGKDKAKVKSKVMKDYGAEIKKHCKELSSEKISESEERPYVCVHAKKGKYECKASSSYGAAKKAAEHWKLKSTAGIDCYLADVEHTAVNESLSLKGMFEKLSAELLSENSQITMQPAQQNTQVIKKDDKVVGTVSNPGLAAQLKRGIESGDVSLDQEMNEESLDEKWAGDAEVKSTGQYSDKTIAELKSMLSKLKKSGPHKKGSKEYERQNEIEFAIRAKKGWKGGVSEADIPSNDADFGAGLGAGRSQATFEGRVKADQKAEKAGKKVTKDIEYDEKKAAKNKSKQKKTVKEGMNHRLLAARFEGKSHGLKGHAYHGKSYEDMEEARAYHEGYREGLDECYGYGMNEQAPPATVSGMASQAMLEDSGSYDAIASELEEIAEQIEELTSQAVSILPSGSIIKERATSYWYGHIMQALGSESYGRTFSTTIRDTIEELRDPDEYEEFDEGNAFTAALAKTPKGEKFSVGGKSFTDTSSHDDQLDEFAFESWDRELQDLLNEGKTTELNEGLSVSISKGQQGMPDSVSVTAQDADADELLSLIKGLGGNLFGGADNQMPEPQGEEMPAQQADIEVVDDHDDMLAMMKKMSGGDDDMMSQESSCGMNEEETEDEMEFEVAEDNQPDSGAEDSVADEDAEAEEDQALAGADSDHEEDLEESDEMSVGGQVWKQAFDNPFVVRATVDNVKNEIVGSFETIEDAKEAASGYPDAKIYNNVSGKEVSESDENLTEWANDANNQREEPDSFEQDIEFMTKVISGGLNKQKKDQTTLPHTKVKESDDESPEDWMKLAGIK